MACVFAVLIATMAAVAFANPLTAPDAAKYLEIRAPGQGFDCVLQKSGTTINTTYRANLDNAIFQGNIAGLQPRGSGYPHRYEGRDGIVWGNMNPGCDGKEAELWEYPIYPELIDDRRTDWTGGAWNKEAKVRTQRPTPIRTVYVADRRTRIPTVRFCGVMTHSQVAANGRGEKFFRKCN